MDSFFEKDSVFRTSRERAEGQKFFTLNGGMLDTPEIARCIEKTLPEKGAVDGIGFSLTIPGDGERRMALSGWRLDSSHAASPHFILTFEAPSDKPDGRDKQECQ